MLFCLLSFSNLFFFWTMNDLIWVGSLVLGFTLFMSGHLIYVAQSQPLSREQRRKRRLQMIDCIIAITLSIAMLLFILINLAKS
jgi:amino acid transporter